MPRYKSGVFEVKDVKGNLIAERMLIQTKKARDDMRKEGYSFKRVG